MDLTPLMDAMTGFGNAVTGKFSLQGSRLADHAVLIEQLQTGKANYRSGRFVTTQAEFDQTANAAPDQQAVFNNWYRFSHVNTTPDQPAAPAELLDWTYTPEDGWIRNTTNSATFIGVVSETQYDDYYLDLKLTSANVDDDTIGVVIAWYKDPVTGHEDTLTLLRDPGGNGILYSVYYNRLNEGQKVVANGKHLVTWGNGAAGALSRADAGFVTNTPGWAGLAAYHGSTGGARVRIIRDGDVFKIYTAQWQTPDTIDPATELIVDLSTDPVLEKFRGPRSYGLCSNSQAASTWEIQSFTNPKDNIFNLATGEVWEFIGNQWVLSTEYTLADLGKDVFLYNPDLKRMFFMKDSTQVVALDSTVIR